MVQFFSCLQEVYTFVRLFILVLPIFFRLRILNFSTTLQPHNSPVDCAGELFKPSKESASLLVWVTLNGRPRCQMKNMNYPRAGELHRRVGRQAALQDWLVGCTLRGPAGCGKGWSGGLPFSAAHPALFRSPPHRLFVQPALLSCLLCSPSTVHIFQLETWPSSPPDPPTWVFSF